MSFGLSASACSYHVIACGILLGVEEDVAQLHARLRVLGILLGRRWRAPSRAPDRAAPPGCAAGAPLRRGGRACADGSRDRHRARWPAGCRGPSRRSGRTGMPATAKTIESARMCERVRIATCGATSPPATARVGVLVAASSACRAPARSSSVLLARAGRARRSMSCSVRSA